jgi:hypothetical protein
MRVGITIGLTKGHSIWSNGLVQNVLMFYDLMKEVPGIESVKLLDMHVRPASEYKEDYPYLEGYNVVYWDDEFIHDQFDVVVVFGITPTDSKLRAFKRGDKSKKVVAYKGGNVAVMQMEHIVYRNNTKSFSEEGKELELNGAPIIDIEEFDEIWMVPQQEFHNTDIFEIHHGTKARSVPFIWSSKFIDEEIKLIRSLSEDSRILFEERYEEISKWRVASMEPNKSVLKNAYPLIYGFEHAYSINPNIFEKFKICNSMEQAKNKYLIRLVHGRKFYQDGLLQLAPRWSVVHLLSKQADAIFSHQWGNPLNYAYLDTVYLGYPLVHNAHLCQDIGYYYEDWKMKDAGSLLVKALEERKQDETYTQRHREILKRYTKDNKDMLHQYKLLFDNLWNKNDMDGATYDWKTNLLI